MGRLLRLNLMVSEGAVIYRLHTVLVLGHILALALGLGSALLADWIVLRKLAFGTVNQKAVQQLIDLSRAVSAGLVLIWITGALLVADNALDAPASVMNQKLWAKLAVVTALTMNAVLLHRIVMPMVRRRVGQPLFEAVFDWRLMVSTLLGAVSAVSWVFAAYLGVARELNGHANLVPILVSYFSVLLLTWALGVILMYSMQQRRTGPEQFPFGETHIQSS